MQIKFNNGKTFEYTQAYSLERDFKDGYTRPSLEIIMPYAQTNFNEIYNLLHSEAVNKITLVGEPVTLVNENGETVTEKATSINEYYNIVGKIAVEDENISFKLYRLSDTEIEKNSAISAVDELLLTMAEEV